MHITRKHISRRTVLKGMGVTVALPVLDAMLPAGAWTRRASAAGASNKTRLVCMEMVHGSAGSTVIGIQKNLFAPAKVGRDFEFSPILGPPSPARTGDRKSTRLNSSHVSISYAVFCLKKKTQKNK